MANAIQILERYWQDHPTWFGRSFGEYLHLGANEEMLRIMLAGVPIDSTTVVLDLACALGGNARWLASCLGCRVEGVDAFRPAIAAARQLAKAHGLAELCHFTAGECDALPFAPAHFDIAVTAEDEVAWKEIARVVKTGGHALGSFVAIEGIELLRSTLESVGFCVEHVLDVTPYALAFYRAKEAEARLLVDANLMPPQHLESLQIYGLDIYESGGARHALFRARRS